MMVSIAEFYAGRCVFITGATGFIGKVLLEKLLRSCPAIRVIYLLIRSKKGVAVQMRLDALLESKLFDNVRESQPSFAKKVVPIAGDILEPCLGISADDVQRIVADVSVVFHSAATVKFDEPLKLSVEMNVVGVQRILDLCHQIDRLEALVHISTAYANCDRRIVNETVYPSPICPQKLVTAMEWMDVDVVEVLTKNLIGSRPNTYTFTKAVAESLLVQRSKGLACAIVRPSIVGSSWREPVEGWVDNFNGPTGIFAAIGKGMLRVMMGDVNASADIIPVDMVVNLILAVGWCTAIDQRSDEVQVYNCTTGQSNKVTWGDIERSSVEGFTSYPLDMPVRHPYASFTLSRVYYALNNWFDQVLPAWFMDLGLKLTGQKPILLHLNARMWRSVACLEYFTTHEWTFTTDNTKRLYDRMSTEEKEIFSFDVTRINWPTYLHNYCLGVKRYALNEPLHNLSRARLTLRKLRVRRLLKQLLFAVAGWFILSRILSLKRLLYSCLSLCVRAYSRLMQIISGNPAS